MANENHAEETVEIELSENMEQALGVVLDEAAQKLVGPDGLVPFTAILHGENIAIEEHDGDTPEECRASAKKALNVDPASVDGYAFVYDGYVEMDESGEDVRDAIIVEFAEPDDANATVLCQFFTETSADDADEYAIELDEGLAVVGECESLIPEEYRVVEDDEGDEGDA